MIRKKSTKMSHTASDFFAAIFCFHDAIVYFILLRVIVNVALK